LAPARVTRAEDKYFLHGLLLNSKYMHVAVPGQAWVNSDDFFDRCIFATPLASNMPTESQLAGQSSFLSAPVK
jgi:hypothetical protein